MYLLEEMLADDLCCFFALQCPEIQFIFLCGLCHLSLLPRYRCVALQHAQSMHRALMALAQQTRCHMGHFRELPGGEDNAIPSLQMAQMPLHPEVCEVHPSSCGSSGQDVMG